MPKKKFKEGIILCIRLRSAFCLGEQLHLVCIVHRQENPSGWSIKFPIKKKPRFKEPYPYSRAKPCSPRSGNPF